MTEKRCYRCKTFKPVTEFYRDASCRDGLTAGCKECAFEYSRTRKQKPQKHPKFDVKKLNAGRLLREAVKRGDVMKWPVCAIPECEETRVHGHHADYDNPLGVTWLCVKHHGRAHALFRRLTDLRPLPEVRPQLRAYGEGHGRSKVTAEQVEFIRASGLRTRALSKQFGIDDSTVRRIRAGVLWQRMKTEEAAA